MRRLSHFAPDGRARMVDVSAKRSTRRQATVEATVRLSPAAFRALMERTLTKGDAFTVAKIAALQAAKRTDELIPLCHALPIEQAEVTLTPEPLARSVRVRATMTTTAKTGIELEAFVAATTAALALYDMVKAVDPAAVISDVQLLSKTGGQRPFFREKSSRTLTTFAGDAVDWAGHGGRPSERS